ncbi:uncharacterized protein HMPREF1541_08252 [Cyphellophora europaea CBS 101466]|uniref:Uncharacterized protein n=1 Tax=Cyphellophora europaea (strain CBS 101466) TaxID=1220924 RepID=W2RL89_CYPE1|nr:uncharacterized protein HMPREF1541_08252 [Cyphellophora europaea CBS 101466]ETN37261.1 hypothetical protein HMPREF1541_08252 [Cyphellophora europaea CBS 101466]
MLSALAVLALVSVASSAPSPSLPEQYKNNGGGGVAQQAIQIPLSKEGVMEFQVASFLQNLEVSFFKQGAEHANGWDNKDTNGVRAADEINRIWAEEESYVETIAELLQYNKASPVEPCQYDFPVSDEKSFFALASIISNVGIGFLINLENRLAKTDPTIIPHISRIIPVKARHDSFFRMYAGEVPNPAAYETTLPLEWAYNLALDFIAPGSCKNPPSYFKDVKVHPDLRLDGRGEATSLTPNSPGALHFTVGQPSMMPQGWEDRRLWIGWANGDNMVQYTPITKEGDKLKADLPEGLFGIVFAALTDQKDVKTTLDLVAKTLAGPLPIPLGPGKYD